MSQNPTDLSDDRRRELFLALVNLQDEGVAVAESRAFIAGQYGVQVEVVQQVEREGLEAGWPPL
ncbi:MAG TPA: hypothetical protein VMZ71_09350 [Gemmataceae bacterium]|nr:hypothetical protein [Gemmataceae bacterium]